MLNLFYRMPEPQLAQFEIGAFEMVAIFEDLGCDDRSQVLDAHRCAQLCPFAATGKEGNKLFDRAIKRFDIVASIDDRLVKADMFPAMCRFLLDEGRDFPLQAPFGAVAPGVQCFDHESLATREHHRQGIEECGGEHVAADPMPRWQIGPGALENPGMHPLWIADRLRPRNGQAVDVAGVHRPLFSAAVVIRP